MPISDNPEKNKLAEATAVEFIKFCNQRGLELEQMIQAAVVVGAAAMETEAGDDKAYLAELVDRFEVSLRSAVQLSKEKGAITMTVVEFLDKWPNIKGKNAKKS